MRWRVVLTFALLLVALAGSASADLEQGKAVYDKYCGHCHGAEGDGQGVAAPFLKPAPRNFTSGKYKIRHTPTGYMPTDEDLIRSVAVGLPYTSMPGFADALSDAEIASVVEYLKTFSADFEDPEAFAEPIPIPEPPPLTAESVERGTELYVETGCGACHGEVGLGDGSSAPTLVDDWGVHIKVADLSLPWTFRGGSTRKDIFRTMSSGFNGTPMPGFHGALPPEDIWGIVDYIVSLSDGASEAAYDNLVRAVGYDGDLDLALGDELFAAAPPAIFAVIGQIIEPGRNFYPATTAVQVQAVYTPSEIAFRISWHDMRAETSGSNAPDLPAPAWLEELAGQSAGGATDADDEGGDFWGEEESADDEGGGFWGEEEVGGDDGDADFWGEEEEGGEGDFWGDDDDSSGTPAVTGPSNEFSDAIAIQFPQTLPEGIRKPYFLFGDAQNPVELWFADLGKASGQTYVGRGSVAVTPSDGIQPQVNAKYEQGEWSVIFKRQREVRGGISFAPDTFVPIALSVWDGFNRERGNRRGLTRWYYLYMEPLERPSPLGPMAKAALGVLIFELLLIGLVRFVRRRRQQDFTLDGDAVPSTS